MKQLLVLTLLLFTTFTKAETCITKAEALKVAEVGVEVHNNSIDSLREELINLDDVLNDMEFNGFRYIYSRFVTNDTIEEVTVSCSGVFFVDYYFED